MQNYKNHFLSAALLLAAAFLTLPMKAQVTIGAQEKPDINAVLDLRANTKLGLLLPRLNLTATNSASPMSAHVQGMVVYNLATAGTEPNNVTPGFYYNDGTKWIRIPDVTTASNGLTKTGNNIALGGTLTQATTINQGANTLTLSGTGKTAISTPLQYTDGNQAGGKVLTSDPNGNATWQIPETALTIRGTVTQEQNKQIPMSLFAGGVATGGSVSMDPLSYIDIPPGLWRIDASIPFMFNEAVSANSWIEFMVVFSTNSTTTDANTAVNAGTGYPMAFVQSPFPAGLISRGFGFIFLNNTSGVTQRYYAGIGRVLGPATWTTDFAGKTITYMGSGRTAYIYATSTNFAP